MASANPIPNSWPLVAMCVAMGSFWKRPTMARATSIGPGKNSSGTSLAQASACQSTTNTTTAAVPMIWDS